MSPATLTTLPRTTTRRPTVSGRARGQTWRARLLVGGMVLMSGLLATGCLTAPALETDGDAPRLRMNLTLERPTSANMRLTTMQVTLISEQGDTLRDLITDAGGSLSGSHVVLNPPQEKGQVLMPRYNLTAEGQWTYRVETRDTQDSVIHRVQGSFIARVDEPLDLPLVLKSRYASYDAIPNTPLKLNENVPARIELVLDGTVIRSLPWTGQTGTRLSFDYLPVGRYHANWKVYSSAHTNGRETLLYQGNKDLEISTQSGTTEGILLAPVASTASLTKSATDTVEGADEGFSLRFGRTGIIVVNVIVPAAVVL